MMTLNQVRAKLRPMNLAVVAKETGVHYNSVYRIVNGSINPKYETVQKIVMWLEGNECK